MKTKRYFSNLDEERCYELASIIEMAKDEGLKEVEIYEAKRATGIEYFWCNHPEIDELCEKDGMTCGKRYCKHYLPRNGKSGICKHYGFCYEATGESFKVKINQEDTQ